MATVFNYTKEECKALNRKFNKPKEVVSCPRCGKNLNYREVNGSSEVKCETNGCIHGTIRGI